MRLSDIQKKDIIYLSDGTKIGRIIDAEIDPDTGRVMSFTVEKKDIKTKQRLTRSSKRRWEMGAFFFSD